MKNKEFKYKQELVNFLVLYKDYLLENDREDAALIITCLFVLLTNENFIDFANCLEKSEEFRKSLESEEQ